MRRNRYGQVDSIKMLLQKEINHVKENISIAKNSFYQKNDQRKKDKKVLKDTINHIREREGFLKVLREQLDSINSK